MDVWVAGNSYTVFVNTFRLSVLALAVFLWGGWQYAEAQNASTAQSSTKTAKTTVNAAPTAQEIADAKSKDLVWVNTNTRVFHKSSSPSYGTTKRGKFMAESDAKKAGYREASESNVAKKHSATNTATK